MGTGDYSRAREVRAAVIREGEREISTPGRARGGGRHERARKDGKRGKGMREGIGFVGRTEAGRDRA